MRKLFSVFYSVATNVFHFIINLVISVKNNVRHITYFKSLISSTERILYVRECKNCEL